MKPQFSLYKHIDGSRSLREFSQKKYKHLSRLRVSKLLKTMSMRNLKSPFPVLHRLSVSVKSLDLSQYDSLEKYSASQIKMIAKRFHNVLQLSLLGTKDSTEGLLLAKTMLKKAKFLRHLHLKETFDSSSSEQLLHLISQSKLKTISLIPISSVKFDYAPLLNFSKYCPSTVERLSLYWKNQIRGVSNLSISHLENLQKLELGMPLALETFQGIIKSIRDPSKLKSLQIHLEKYFKKKSSATGVKAFLGSWSNLEELSLNTDLHVYPDNLNVGKLKKLSVELSEDPSRVVDFILQQKDSLESFSLTSKISRLDPSDGIFKGLKSLKKLKKLKLNLKTEMSSVNSFDLAELVEQLEELEEADFLDLLVIFSEDDFSSFCRTLQMRSVSLRSLKLSFNNFNMNQKNSNMLVQTLKVLPQLEHLTLENFGVEDPNFYNELRDLICHKNKVLNEVILKGFKRGKTRECCESLINMLRGVIKKPTMKKLCYLEAAKCGFASDFKDFEILSLTDDVRKEVHHFDYLHLPSYTCEPTFYFWNLSWHKWTQE